METNNRLVFPLSAAVSVHIVLTRGSIHINEIVFVVESVLH